MTDCTPHESLPLPKGTSRQFFRLVTSKESRHLKVLYRISMLISLFQQVSVWYADHSTPNPLGIEPPKNVVILRGSKFQRGEPVERTFEESSEESD